MKRLLLLFLFAVLISSQAVTQSPIGLHADGQASRGWISPPRPNPASVSTTFEFSLGDNANDARILIRNLTGVIEIAQVLDIATSKQTIDISSLRQGMYLYSLEVNGRIIHTQKLVVGR